jgi:hypothetical protein
VVDAANLWRHRCPLPVADLVLHYVVRFREKEESNREQIDDDQIAVAAFVKRLVVVTIQICTDDITALDHHCTCVSDAGQTGWGTYYCKVLQTHFETQRCSNSSTSKRR